MPILKGTKVVIGHEKYEISVLSADWVSKTNDDNYPFIQEIAVADIKETDLVNIYPIWNEDFSIRDLEKIEYSKINEVYSENGKVVFYCDSKIPNLDLNLRIEVVR